ncbi:MAG: hypothetical protein V3T83_14505, partial [Acidobacteriota bacterium]
PLPRTLDWTFFLIPTVPGKTGSGGAPENVPQKNMRPGRVPEPSLQHRKDSSNPAPLERLQILLLEADLAVLLLLTLDVFLHSGDLGWT